MAAIVGALRAVLSLESAAFQKGLSNAQKSLQGFDKRMKAIGGKLQGIGVVISAAGAGIAAAMKGQIDAADEMSKAAQKFGVPIDQLSRLKYAADLSDVSFESLGTSLGRLSKAMVGTPDQFAEIGVSITDAEGKMRNADAVLTDLADVFAGMPDGAEKTALAIKLFGRSGADMIPLLNGGSAALAELRAEADRLGVTMNEKFGKDAETFNDDLNRLSVSLGVMSREITEALLPVMQSMVDGLRGLASWFVDLTPAVQAFIAKAAGITVVAGPLVIALGTLVSSLGAVAIAIKGITLLVAANPIGAALTAIAVAATLIYTNWEGIAAFFEDLWSRVTASAKAAWTAITDAWNGAVTWFRDLLVVQLPTVFDEAWTAIKAKFFQWVEDFRQLGRDIWKGLSEGILGSRDMTNVTMGNAMDGLIVTAEDAVDSHSPSRVFAALGRDIMAGLRIGIEEGGPGVNAAMQDIAGSAGGFDALKKAAQDASSAVKSAFNGLFDDPARALKDLGKQLLQIALNMQLMKMFPSLFGSGGMIPLAGALAAGGPVSAGRAYLVGERGPELMVPNMSGRVIPNHALGGGGGGGGTVVQVFNSSGAAARTEKTRTPDGRELVKVIVGEEFARGGFDKPMRRFGAAPTPVKR